MRRWTAVAAMAAIVVAGCTDPAEKPEPPEDLTPVSGRPEPDPTTPAPAGAVTEANLPAELTWDGQALTPAPGLVDPTNEQVSVCQQNSLAYFGADASFARAYGEPGTEGFTTVVVMSFLDAEAAEFATSEWGRWIDQCDQILHNARDADQTEHLVADQPVPLPDGQGTFNQWRWAPAAESVDGATGGVEAEGLITAGDRVALIATHQGEPGPWSTTDPGAADAHPTLAAMPQVAAALTAR